MVMEVKKRIDLVRAISNKLVEVEGKELDKNVAGEIIDNLEEIRKGLENFRNLKEFLGKMEEIVKAKEGEVLDLETSDLLFKALDSIALSLEKGEDAVSEDILKELENIKPVKKEKKDILDNELYTLFRDESLDLISGLENKISPLKDYFSENLMRDVMRSMHTIKGNARLIGSGDIAKVSHACETLLQKAIRERRALGEDASKLILEAKDVIEDMVLGKKVEKNRLEKILSGLEKVELGGVSSDKVECAISQEKDTIRVPVGKIEDVIKKAAELRVFAIKGLDIISSMRNLERTVDDIYSGFLKLCDLIRKEIGEGTINLDFEKIVKKGRENFDALKNSLAPLKSFLYETQPVISNRINDLLERIESLRMYPFRTISILFPRLVRETSEILGKKVKLVVEGEDVEVDKDTLEKLREPLVHLIRNAIDHGIEKPDERKKLGKKEEGLLKISASRKGEFLEISVEDDGRGIDLEKVKEKAMKDGIEISDDLVSLLFRPGFSTRSETNEFSGRGVGLDIVKNTVDLLRGRVDISTSVGKGTKIILSIPVSRSVVKGLVFAAGDGLFMVSTPSSSRVERVKRSEIKTLEGMNYVDVGGEEIEVFSPFGEVSSEKVDVIVLSSRGRKFGVIVDKIEGIFETIMRFSLGISRGFVQGYGILPDSRIAQVLDVDRFFEYLKGRKSGIRFFEEERPEEKEVLVVDDSVTTRVLVKTILEGEGIKVDLANDGIEALEKLKEKKYELALVDIDMPGIDGFELTRRIKSSQKLKNMPVVILTSKGSSEDLKKGLEVGADGYFVKGRFDREEFLETVRRFV